MPEWTPEEADYVAAIRRLQEFQAARDALTDERRRARMEAAREAARPFVVPLQRARAAERQASQSVQRLRTRLLREHPELADGVTLTRLALAGMRPAATVEEEVRSG